jgi:FG-GAP-like repeat
VQNTSRIFVLLLFAICYCSCQNTTEKPSSVGFKKHILTKKFVSEGVASADINHDNTPDIIAGSYWFEAPNWVQHQYSTPIFYGRSLEEKGKIEVNEGYSNSFLNFSLDVNLDGWADIIRIGLPGEKAEWYENNKNKTGLWKSHALYQSIGNESPAFIDVDKDGRNDLIFADSKAKKILWLSAPTSSKDTTWQSHIISADSLESTHQYTHGLGFFDINNDNRSDLIVKNGWWEAPADPKTQNWLFHKTNIGEDAAQMYGQDVDQDGDVDVISSSAHYYGIWWHESNQSNSKNIANNFTNNFSFDTKLISNVFSQSHNLSYADINNDGHLDIITGKRFMAHNGQDPGEYEPRVLYWHEFEPGKTPKWQPHLIDNNSGAGLHSVVIDMNNDGRKDILVANKNGVHYFEQIKK